MSTACSLSFDDSACTIVPKTFSYCFCVCYNFTEKQNILRLESHFSTLFVAYSYQFPEIVHSGANSDWTHQQTPGDQHSKSMTDNRSGDIERLTANVDVVHGRGKSHSPEMRIADEHKHRQQLHRGTSFSFTHFQTFREEKNSIRSTNQNSSDRGEKTIERETDNAWSKGVPERRGKTKM